MISQCFFNRPSLAQPRKQRLSVNAQAVGPFGSTQRLAVECQQASRAFVAILNRLNRPAAVSRLVAAIVVYAINGMCWRCPWSHVGQEIRKRFAPAVADSNTTTAIASIATRSRVAASLDYCVPRIVFGRSAPTVRCVSPVSGSSNFRVIAAATSRKITSQVSTEDYRLRSARTSAFPQVMMAALSRIGDDCPAIEREPSKVHESRIARQFVHDIFSFAESIPGAQ